MSRWSEEEIFNEINIRMSSGKSLKYADVRNDNPALLSVIEKKYGSWYKALEIAGIDASKIRKQKQFGYWDAEKVIEEIKTLESEKLDLTMSVVRKTKGALVHYAIKYYGSWYEALEAAGIDSEKYRKAKGPNYWSKETVISELKDLYQNNKDIRPISLSQNFPGLIGAGRKIFGSSEAMYIAAGIDINDIGFQQRWTKDTASKTLKELNLRGIDVKPYNLCSNGYTGLVYAGTRLFGSIEEFYKAADVDLTLIGYKKRKSLKYTESEVIQFLQELDIDGEDLSPGMLQKTHGGLYSAGIKLFDSPWKMLEAAGIEPTKYYTNKPRGYWTRETIIAKIIELRNENISLKRRRDNASLPGDLVRASEHYFGSWWNACEAAGIPNDEYQQKIPNGYYSADNIIKEIIALHNDGIDLSASSIIKNQPNLYYNALTRFGSWFKAIDLSGIDSSIYRKQVEKGYWTKDKILTEIKELAYSTNDLSYTSIQSINPRLISMSEKRFGSWAKALQTLGINYDVHRKQHKKYEKDELLNFLKMLKNNKIPLDWSSIREVNDSIAMAIINRFGKYENAIKELGLDYDLIRRNSRLECFKGHIFENYVKDIFDILEINNIFKKQFKYEEECCYPDFYFSDTGIWADAKLHSWGWSVEKSAQKYLKYCSVLLIIYLKGKPRQWYDNRITFLPVSHYYEQLKAAGANSLIEEIEMLKKGIIKPEYQAKLDKFVTYD